MPVFFILNACYNCAIMGMLSNQNNNERDPVDLDAIARDDDSLLRRLEKLEQENADLKKKIYTSYSEVKNNNLPSKDEIESISSMIDIINKIDEETLEKIERLKKHD